MIELLQITWRDLLNPEFYINNGGLWVMMFIVFAETGLMVGFFLPGDSLLFVAGIYSQNLVDRVIPGGTGSDFADLMILLVLVAACRHFGKYGGVLVRKKERGISLLQERYLDFQEKTFVQGQGIL